VAVKGGPVHRGVGGLPDRALLLLAVLIYAFLYAPILVLIAFSFNSSRSTQVWTGFSAQWYGELLRDQSVLDAFRTSLIVGVAATAIATVIGTLTALALARNRFRGKTVADSAIYAATVMPEVVVGVSLLVFFVASGLALGITTIIIAHVAFTVSFVTIVVRARLSGMDRSLEEAAQDLGASPVRPSCG
jgi:ABC-type spermidine/putrescine transport system permease subunit II